MEGNEQGDWAAENEAGCLGEVSDSLKLLQR